MNVYEFLEKVGCKPAKVKNYLWTNGEYRMVERDNNELLIRSNRKNESDLVRNNLKSEVLYGRIHGPIMAVAFKIRGGFAFYTMNLLNGFNLNRIKLDRFKELVDMLDKHNKMDILAHNEDKMKLLFLTEELGGK